MSDIKYYIKVSVGGATLPEDKRTELYAGQDEEFVSNILKAKLYDSRNDAYNDADCAHWQAQAGDMLCWSDEIQDYDYGYEVCPYPDVLLRVREMLKPEFWAKQTYMHYPSIDNGGAKQVGATVDLEEMAYLLRMGGLNIDTDELATVFSKIAARHLS